MRVRLLQVAPQQVFLETPEHNQDWLLIRGYLERQTLQERENRTNRLMSGQPYRQAQGQSYQFTNPADEPAEILELEWGTSDASTDAFLPLGDVTEERPWGSFTVLEDQLHYKLKQLMVHPGSRLSLQRHQKREEHWFVVAGQPEVTLNEQVLTPSVGAYIKIPLHAWHRLANPETSGNVGQEPVEIIELQLGEYFGEDDIERREDDYGRV